MPSCSSAAGLSGNHANLLVRRADSDFRSEQIDDLDVFTLDLDLKFSVAVIAVPFADVPVQLADGCFAVGDATFRNAMPFPFDRNGPVVAEFVDCHGRLARITSRFLELHAVSNEVLLESFPGTDA